jgi:prepilin-type N-terminal cleavage/methylation domain-containing protein
VPSTDAIDSRAQRGFTAVELVVVIAASLLVAALGVSMYRTQHVRSQIAVSVEYARPAQHLVVAAFNAAGTPPADAAAAGIGPLLSEASIDTYYDLLEVSHGRIDLTFGERADAAIAGKTLSLTPFEAADRQIVWVCGNRAPDVGLAPLGFMAGGAQATQALSSIEDRYLPPSCR